MLIHVVLSTEARDTLLPDLVILLPTVLALGSSWVVLLLVSGNQSFMLVLWSFARLSLN